MAQCRKWWKYLRRWYRKKVTTLKTVTPREAVQWMLLKKCCCCFPLRAGVGLLIVVQMICLTPFTLSHHTRKDNTWIFATILLVLLVLSAISFMWAIVYECAGFLPLTIYVSCGNLIFYFIMLDRRYAEGTPAHHWHHKDVDDKILLTFTIIGIASYFYLVFIVYNVYLKLKLLHDPQQQDDSL